MRRSWALPFLAILAGLGLIVAGCSSSPEPTASSSPSGQGEVFLEAKDDTGPDPFTESTVGDFEDSRDSDEASASPEESESGSSDGESSGIQSTVGTTDELYGGSGDQTICDTAQLKQFLTDNSDKAAAWAGVLGISTGQIPSYIDSLAPVVLDNDIRVTNHGFADGRATARQSVLQAGTAVLVDDRGVPRVRCACGNPLLEPVATTVGSTYVGTTWVSFNPTVIIVIVPGIVVKQLVVVNIKTGQPIKIPVGSSSGTPSQSPTGEPSQSSAPSQSPTASSSPGDTSGDYTSCAKRYGELVIEMKVAGVEPSQKQLERWTKDAQEAAKLANQGNLDAARGKICATVEEMEGLVG